MKKLFLTLLAIMLTTCMMANPVYFRQAKNIASKYLKEGETPRLAKRHLISTLSDDTIEPIYIFSRGAGEGFVIISGDDLLPEVIGYTDAGDYDENDMPEALKDMIDYYSKAALTLREDVSMQTAMRARKMARRAAGTRDIPYLMTSHWHQSWPYNNLCPHLTSNGATAVTGCVATASSQIIYYWRKDVNDRTQYDTPTYGYGDAPATEEYRIKKGTPLKWNLMQDSYAGTDPAECTTAVATLMATVGMSGWLTYGSSTAGQISDQIGVLSGQFGLNGGSCVWKGNYSQTTWERMIVQDLELGRPILYSGVHPSNGGHAVVIDGYKVSSNLFHFNFGWGSGNGYDGYYTVDDVTGMNGFNEGQGMVWNIYPKNPRVTGKIIFSVGELLSRVDNTISVKITNNATLPASGFHLYALTGTNMPTSSTNPQASNTTTVIPTGGSAVLTFTISPSSTSDYSLYLTDANRRILDKITKIPTIASVPDLRLNAMIVDDGGESETLSVDGRDVVVKHVFNSGKTDVVCKFTNGDEGTICAPSVKGILYAWDGSEFKQSTTKTKKNVTFAKGATEDMVFDLTSLKDNTIYKFTLAGTATTNRNFDIDITTPDSVVYFKLVGPNLTMKKNEDGHSAVVEGNFNSAIFSTMTVDSCVSIYDMTGVRGVKTPLIASNKNALFYVNASQGVNGRNIVADNVCDDLDLTPGYDFMTLGDFKALRATYHATQGVGKYATAYLPFDAPTPSGMFARRVNMVKTNYLQEVDSCNLDMMGGTPYIIITGEPVDIKASNVDVSTSVPSLGTDTLRGTFVNKVASANELMLDDAETQYFNVYTDKVIPALTAYLDYTKKVRATSYPYNTKDKKARQLAQQIEAALAAYVEYADEASSSAKSELMNAIDEARDTLRTQPVTHEQNVQVNALAAAVDAYVNSVKIVADNGLVECTSLIQNPSFELGSLKSWVQSGCSISNTSMPRANYMSGCDGKYVAKINTGGSIEQTLTGLVNGTYRLVALGAADYGKHITIHAGMASATIEATDFGPMYMSEIALDDVIVSDGTLTIGASASDGWVKIDNFRLYLVQADETPVNGVQVDAQPRDVNGIYDLQGRKYEQVPARGIYVVNGKKVLR